MGPPRMPPAQGHGCGIWQTKGTLGQSLGSEDRPWEIHSCLFYRKKVN